jgi:two-component system alkaline phosphatase synthesis response regulator PhoP
MKKILHIEDEQDQIVLVKALLERRGYEVILAQNSEEGLNKAREDKPDLILLDVFLPKGSGFSVCKQLKEAAETKHIPIIMVTGSGDKHIEEQCKSVGANSCIIKPYEAKNLIERIEEVLK